MILIIDFGSQTTHLIGRRIKDLGVAAEIVAPDKALGAIKKLSPKGIILSGGPSSVYIKEGLLAPKEIFQLGMPVLGICYGLQIMSHMLGGKVTPGKKKEYGPASFTQRMNTAGKPASSLFKGIPKTIAVWMSHFDEVISPPAGATLIGSTETIKVAAFANEAKNFYGIQFHPEAHHTQSGIKILENFIFDICGELPQLDKLDKLVKLVTSVKKQIGDKKAVCALSGGIDSAVAAALTHQAIGNHLTCFYVDTGMMRKGESEQVAQTFKKHFKFKLRIIRAQKEFLADLKGIIDPEQKRKIIGNTFIRIFEAEAKKIGAQILIQGTIYPDVIESKGSQHARNIKTHHNVGGIPESHLFQIVEPLRLFYKDEVRALAKILHFPATLTNRQPFPGPGLAVRIIGEVTREKLDILRQADSIVVEEIKKAGLYEKIWMAFAVFTGIKTTGVGGDERKYGETIALRILESKDAMSADWAKIPYEVLGKISSRIVTEVFEVTRVVYDITTKPPATMEWE